MARKLMATILALILLMMAATPLSVLAAAGPALSGTSYAAGYTVRASTIPVYTNTSFSTRGTHWPYKAYAAEIWSTDEIRIYGLGSNYAWVGYYSSSRGWIEGFIRLSDLLPTNLTLAQTTYTGSANLTTYKRPGGASYGYIERGDNVWLYGSSGGYYALIYTARSGNRGYKLGYIGESAKNALFAPAQPALTLSVSANKTSGTTTDKFDFYATTNNALPAKSVVLTFNGNSTPYAMNSADGKNWSLTGNVLNAGDRIVTITAKPASGASVTKTLTVKVTAPGTGTATDAKLVYPISGKDIGYAGDSGLDISAPLGTKVYAVADGTIEYSEYGHTPWTSAPDTPYSINIKLDTPIVVNGTTYRNVFYTHMTKDLVYAKKDGSSTYIHVSKGQLLGYSGIGNKVPHLHIGFYTDRSNSQKYLPMESVRSLFQSSYGMEWTAQKAVGTGTPPATSTPLFPLKGTVKTSSTVKTNGFYCDYYTGGSVPVYAPADGTAVFKQAYTTIGGVATLTSYGNWIEFTSPQTQYVVRLAHLNSFNGVTLSIPSSRTKQKSGGTSKVLAQRAVKRGELLGYSGMTGNASGHHLHIEAYKNNKAVDPKTAFAAW